MVPLSLTCATCGRECKNHYLLQMHVRSHTEERPYKCFHCDKAFKIKYQANRHMISHSKNNIAEFSCSVEGCPKKFKLERTMKRHIGSAHILHKCTFDGCELAFNKKNKMRRHRETHNDGKFLKCTFEGCTLMFARRRNLLRHLGNHENVFKCRVLGCDMVVKSWSEYKKHIQTHKKIHCTKCDVVCPHKTAFKKHCKEAHPEPKQAFDCPYEGCFKTYSRGSNLNQHIRVQHDGQRYHCHIEGCGKKFRHNLNLKHHISSHERKNKKRLRATYTTMDKVPVNPSSEETETGSCTELTETPSKKKKKRKRKSLAAKLARYNGELCELPVTYVDPNDDQSSATLSKVSFRGETHSQECSDISTDSSSHKEDKKEGKSPALGSVEDTSLSLCSESIPNTLIERLQSVIKDSQYHVNELCSTESNSENSLSKEHTQVLECAASS